MLGSPVLGDIQLSMCDKRGDLEVEVIRARGLQSKAGSKVLPVPWAKVIISIVASSYDIQYFERQNILYKSYQTFTFCIFE